MTNAFQASLDLFISTMHADFPHLRHATVHVLEHHNNTYNCMAWALGITDRWVWPSDERPDIAWPFGLPRTDRLDNVEEAFASLGYTPSRSARYVRGTEKIALFGRSNTVLHLALQTPAHAGMWTSKLGGGSLIAHSSVDAVSGAYYGNRLATLERSII